MNVDEVAPNWADVNKNIATAIKSWPTTVLFLMGRTTDDECYQQVVMVAVC